MKKVLIKVFALIVLSNGVFASIPLYPYNFYSNLNFNMLHDYFENPALAGFNNRHSFRFKYNDFMPGFKNDYGRYYKPKKLQLGYDFGTHNNLGLAVYYENYRSGIRKQNLIGLSTAYEINVSEYHNFRIGANLSFSKTKYKNVNSFIPHDDGDPLLLYPNADIDSNLQILPGLALNYEYKRLYFNFVALRFTAMDIKGSDYFTKQIEYEKSASYISEIGYQFVLKESSITSEIAVFQTFKTAFKPSITYSYGNILAIGIGSYNLENIEFYLGIQMPQWFMISGKISSPLKSMERQNAFFTHAHIQLQYQLR